MSFARPHNAPIPKKVPKRPKRGQVRGPFRSADYRQWVSQCPCLFSGAHQNNVAHHHRKGTGGGTGLKPSDLYCVSLTDARHKEYHQTGTIGHWTPGYCALVFDDAIPKYITEAVEAGILTPPTPEELAELAQLEGLERLTPQTARALLELQERVEPWAEFAALLGWPETLPF